VHSGKLIFKCCYIKLHIGDKDNKPTAPITSIVIGHWIMFKCK